jgi:hypothetical protein
MHRAARIASLVAPALTILVSGASYPVEAPDLASIEQEAARASSSEERVRLVESAATIPGDSALPFLRSQLDTKFPRSAQVAAARALLLRGERNVIALMIKAWQDIQRPLRGTGRLVLEPADIPGQFVARDHYREAGELIGLLAGSGDPRAIDALAAEGPGSPVEVRIEILVAFLPPDRFMGLDKSYRGVHSLRWHPADLAAAPGGAPKEALDAAIEKLVRTDLSDCASLSGLYPQYGDKSQDSARVCDIAAFTLATRWPERYRFDLAASAAERDATIIAMRSRTP